MADFHMAITVKPVMEKLERFHSGYNIDLNDLKAWGSGVVVFYKILPHDPKLTAWSRVAYFVAKPKTDDICLEWSMTAGDV